VCHYHFSVLVWLIHRASCFTRRSLWQQNGHGCAARPSRSGLVPPFPSSSRVLVHAHSTVGAALRTVTNRPLREGWSPRLRAALGYSVVWITGIGLFRGQRNSDRLNESSGCLDRNGAFRRPLDESNYVPA